MNFSEKLKTLRKQKNISQELLAEKLHVSRQAITKWESGTGIPDIANIISISALFNESIDSLLSEEKSLMSKQEFLYESRVEYDLDQKKKMDFKLGFVHEVIFEKTANEKVEMVLSSNKIAEISRLAKVKIVEDAGRMDVSINHNPELTELMAKENLHVCIRVPEKIVEDVELSAQTEDLRIRDIKFDGLEYAGTVQNLTVSNTEGHIELDTNSSINAEICEAKGKIDFNQIKAISRLHFAQNTEYALWNAGRGTRFVDSEGNEIPAPRKEKELAQVKTPLLVELNGMKSEIQIQ